MFAICCNKMPIENAHDAKDISGEEVPEQHKPSFVREQKTPHQIKYLWDRIKKTGTSGILVEDLIQLVDSI